MIIVCRLRDTKKIIKRNKKRLPIAFGLIVTQEEWLGICGLKLKEDSIKKTLAIALDLGIQMLGISDKELQKELTKND